MRDDNQFFSLNHATHFERGFCYNITIHENSWSMTDTSLPQSVFISRVLDTKEVGCVWFRALLQLDTPFTLHCYASDSKQVTLADGRVSALDEILTSDKLTATEKRDLVCSAPFWGSGWVQGNDVLLTHLTGRYVWCMLTFTSGGLRHLPHLRLYYPAFSFVSYLPESYQGDPAPDAFFKRFVAIFQSLYLDLDEQIAAFPAQLDPMTADVSALHHMSSWFGLTACWEFGEEKMRLLLSKALDLFHIWGTKTCIQQMIQLLCDCTPYLQEHFKQGQQAFGFTVLIPERHYHPHLTLLLSSLRPAHTTCRLVYLQERITLNNHSYIGVNSRLSDWTPLTLDSHTTLGIHSLGKEADA